MAFHFDTPPSIPFMRYEAYSRMSGEPVGIIKQKVLEGIYIIKKKKLNREKPVLNMYALHEIAARE